MYADFSIFYQQVEEPVHFVMRIPKCFFLISYLFYRINNGLIFFSVATAFHAVTWGGVWKNLRPVEFVIKVSLTGLGIHPFLRPRPVVTNHSQSRGRELTEVRLILKPDGFRPIHAFSRGKALYNKLTSEIRSRPYTPTILAAVSYSSWCLFFAPRGLEKPN